MNKYLKLRLRLNLIRHPGHIVLKVEFETEAVRDWCLALCLLKEGLIETLLIGEEKGKKTMELGILNGLERPTRSQANFDSQTTRLTLTQSDLDYLLHFFLKYYRDGIGEVDHLDIEVASATEDGSITFKVPAAMQPVSLEEAKKRLGLD